MTPEEFKFWLKGFLDGKEEIGSRDTKQIKETIEQVTAPVERIYYKRYDPQPWYPGYVVPSYTPSPFWVSDTICSEFTTSTSQTNTLNDVTISA